jgi:hypothetical protein
VQKRIDEGKIRPRTGEFDRSFEEMAAADMVDEYEADLAAANARIAALEASQFEPSWDKAPEWAQWWAMDENGSAFWYADEPTLWRNVGEWHCAPDGDYLEDTSRMQPDWVSTLRRRPQPQEPTE